MPNVYEIVNDKIIRMLKESKIPWRVPWARIEDGGAYNVVTGKSYSFLNQMLLIETGPGAYGSFKQWKERGCSVKPNQKANIIIFWKWPEQREESEENEDETESDIKNHPVLRYHRVFHHSQVEGWASAEDIRQRSVPNPETLTITEAEGLMRRYIEKENIKFDANQKNHAFYSPSLDLISVPHISQYTDPVEYYSTVFHEAVHSTGAKNRLNRIGIQKVAFGSEVYTQEELVAEIGSIQVLSRLGLYDPESDAFNNSVAYIQGWIKSIEKNEKMFVLGASQASKATDYIFHSTLPTT